MKKTARGHAPLRWKTDFEPGMSAGIPALPLMLYAWRGKSNRWGARAARTRHARFGRSGLRIDIAMQTGSTIVMGLGHSSVAIGHAVRRRASITCAFRTSILT
ncbi:MULTISPECIES: hypothetical protein [unclassified Burkholderia]|uniref:hypothetical protein n=1 Tax=unclassified Burkholderia TaxID=2613784 RepID=UPI001624899A|nr:MULTISPECIES: hypothetical protein [unclassified Burkholderia]